MPRANRHHIPGQAFNRRKGRKGTFREDRYHATAVDIAQLLELDDGQRFTSVYQQWIDEALRRGPEPRDNIWSESLAVGSNVFVSRINRALGCRAEIGWKSKQNRYTYCGNPEHLTSPFPRRDIAI